MTKYTETSMVKKEHAKYIAANCNTPEILDLNEEHSLALLLSLVCGAGSSSLEKDKILAISDGTFSIAESAIDFLCAKSPTRKS